MAAVVETHVRGSDTELHSDEEFEEEGDGGSEEGDGGSEEGDGGSEEGDGGSEEGDGGSEEGDGGSEEGDASDDGGSDGEEAEDEAGDPEEDEEANANAGWAEAMAKILSKPTTQNQSTILQKNKDLQKVKEKDRKEQLEKRKQLEKKRSWEMMSRVKPDVVKDREAEKALQRIATRGVVQLFNAVKKHQKTMDEKVKEVGGSERKKAKILSSVSKKDFIDVLRRTEEGPRRSIKKEPEATVTVKQEEEEEAPSWSVLRDDFMMGASMKDWDKESDREGETEERGAQEEESDSD
ncbi:RRP15-like protein [Periophthalmus magnuspinnatus]|uniref:RRP15-like protein n=1 Tax=Periophthalmus magnuspinnatus TaxID=409849 RepID=UPI002436B799|nr:RRP15-like protein [Periophthalmus magnuspinnatus]